MNWQSAPASRNLQKGIFMEQNENRVYPISAVRVCIDECGDGIKGRIYSKMRETPLVFRNCSELLLRTDEFFDECGYPQRFQEKRSFRRSEPTGYYARPQIRLSDSEVLKQKGECRTMDILVRSRRRSGWQGMVMAGDGKPNREFQSEMELLDIIKEEIAVSNR